MNEQALQQQITELLLPLVRALLFFVNKESTLYWPYLAGALFFGAIGWWWFERKPGEGLGHFLRLHLGRRLWGHPSARIEYSFYVVNAVFFVLFFSPLLISSAWAAEQVHVFLASAFGTTPAWEPGAFTRIVYTVLFFVAFDFGRWLAHTLLHEVPLLWEFHKVHHSAEVLTPWTAFRVHPLDLLLTHSVPALTTAPVTGLFLYLYPNSVDAYLFLGVNALLGLTGLIAHLKHWQIWVTYGPLDRWWISPAHHQIHHSAEPKHWGMNRGFELGVWDRWYGTLYVPTREKEQFKMGLGDGTDGQWHTMTRLYFWPLLLAARRVAKTLSRFFPARRDTV